MTIIALIAEIKLQHVMDCNVAITFILILMPQILVNRCNDKQVDVDITSFFIVHGKTRGPFGVVGTGTGSFP